MSRFLDHLLQQKIVSPIQFAEAWSVAAQSLPHIGELIQTHHILTPEVQWTIMERQWQTGETFIAAAKNLGVWNEDVEVRLQAAALKQHSGWVAALVKTGALTWEKLIGALDDFMAELMANNGQFSLAPAFAEVVLPPVDAIQLAPQSGPAAPLCSEYTQLYNNERQTLLLKWISDMQKALTERRKDQFFTPLTAMKEELITILSGARFLQATLSVALIEPLAAYLDRLSRSEAKFSPGLLRESFSLLWQLRECLASSSAESSFVESQRYQKILAEWQQRLMSPPERKAA